MAIRSILLYPNSVLREMASPVFHFDENIHKLLDDMVETMYGASGTVLTAPQIGILQRLMVINSKKIKPTSQPKSETSHLEIINPRLIQREGEKWNPSEGSLSVPNLWGKVQRFEYITIRAQDRRGKEIEIRAEGPLAWSIQHGMDHLDGVLFTDRMREQYEDRELDIRKSAREMLHRVEGLLPWPAAFFQHTNGTRWKIWGAKTRPNTTTTEPGCVADVDHEEGVVWLATPDGELGLLEIQIIRENQQKISIKDWLKENYVQIGEPWIYAKSAALQPV
ncbi:peptide deformylase [Pasteuria penetrans]|uniref:peptide deformylase n=1 Tax=Pasteuria penetrans TaxID=86005 RepID=UPI000FAC0B7F|nr:peptide deformylase [Pasteuria penetrans]